MLMEEYWGEADPEKFWILKHQSELKMKTPKEEENKDRGTHYSY